MNEEEKRAYWREQYYKRKANNPESLKKNNRNSWNKNRDKYNLQRRLKYATNKDGYADKCKEDSKKWRESNKERYLAYIEKWRLENPDKLKEYNENPKFGSDYKKKKNQEWRARNLEIETLSDAIKYRIGTTIPINYIRENYEQLKEMLENGKL